MTYFPAQQQPIGNPNVLLLIRGICGNVAFFGENIYFSALYLKIWNVGIQIIFSLVIRPEQDYENAI